MIPTDLSDPLSEVFRWYDAAVAAGIPQAEAMALATTTPDGRPSVRVVLLKPGHGDLRFFTNRESRKGEELAANPRAALCFFWELLGRQVRIEGRVARLDAGADDAYFASRPRESQLGAWASHQDRPLASMEELHGRLTEAERRFAGQAVPRPPYWGGYRVDPDVIELWQAAPHRLHERVIYERGPGGWGGRRVCP